MNISTHKTPYKRPTNNSHIAFTLIEFLVVLAIIAVLVAFLLPASMRTARGPARRTQCKNNLKQIGLALHNYHDVYNSFPPAYTVDEAGNKLHSWRTFILPFLEQEALYDTIDLSKPWDDPANAAARETILQCYRCPSSSVDSPATHTAYMASVGEAYALHPLQGRKLIDFHDGTSNTVLVFEVPKARAVHWMSPDDVDVESYLNDVADQTDPHEGGGHVLTADGAVTFHSKEMPTTERRESFMINNANQSE